MAYSNVTYTGNGSQQNFAVPFPYLDPSHVAVTVNGIAAAFVWLNPNTVQITATPANNAVVLIARNSNRQARLSSYEDAQVLTEAAMDFDALQLFYVAQEAFDAVASAAVGGDMLRSMNLSDVYDLNAARLNLGALAKAGDSMAGPLFLAGAPGSPNEAATKAYVDSVLGTVGAVSSVNGRAGVVVINSGDVTGALGFSPVNKAGDTMSGLLLLSADPVAALGAATKQYVDAHAGGGGSTNDWTFPAAATSTATATVNKTQAPAALNDGVADISFLRNGGVSVYGWKYNFAVTAAVGAGVTDVGTHVYARSTAINGGGLMGHRVVAAGPKTNTGNWFVGAMQLAPFERFADSGLLTALSGHKTTYGLSIQPAYNEDAGDGAVAGFNVSAGVAFSKSTTGSVKLWTGLLAETDSIAPGGHFAYLNGGSTSGSAPASAMFLAGDFDKGIDFRSATLTDVGGAIAVWLAQGQQINYGSVSKIYEDVSGNLTFSDSIAGAHTLAALAAGGGGSILSTNNTFTGNNIFNKNDAVNAPTVLVESLAQGALSAGGILATGYTTSFDVRKTALISEAAAGFYSTAAYIQHKVTGNTTVNAGSAGLRVALDTTQTRTGSVTNDATAVYAGLRNAGTDVGGFGYHVDAYHAASGSNSVTYGYSAEMYRTTTAGFTIGYRLQTLDAGFGGGQDNDYGFAAIPGGGTTKFKSVFAGGIAEVGVLSCNRGLDFRYLSPSVSSITIPSDTAMFWDTGEGISQKFKSSTGDIEFSNLGTQHFGLGMSNGVLKQWDGTNGAFGDYYVDAAGTQSAVLSVRSGARTSAPANPSSISNWLVIKLDGTKYRLPLYL